MTTLTPHPYAHILRAIADGEAFQKRNHESSPWIDVHQGEVLSAMIEFDAALRPMFKPENYRAKPRTITINGHEVPEPLREVPPKGTRYWVPRLQWEKQRDADPIHWDGGTFDRRALARGTVHLTEEAAQDHAQALLSFTATK